MFFFGHWFKDFQCIENFCIFGHWLALLLNHEGLAYFGNSVYEIVSFCFSEQIFQKIKRER